MKSIDIISNCLKRLLFCNGSSLQYIALGKKNAYAFFLNLSNEAPYYLGVFAISDSNRNNEHYRIIDVEEGYYVYIRKIDLLKMDKSKLTNMKKALSGLKISL